MKQNKFAALAAAVAILGSILFTPAANADNTENEKYTTIINLAADGDGSMDSQSGYTCHANGAVSYAKDGDNTYLIHTPTAYSVLWLSQNTLQTDHTYWYSFDAKSSTSNWVNLWGHSGIFSDGRLVKGGWQTFSGTCTPTATRVGVYHSGNGPFTPYYVDNVKIYDITNAHTITPDANIVLDPECVVTIDGAQKTNAGDTVRFTLKPGYAAEPGAVTMNGEPLQAADGLYTFKMPAEDVVLRAEVKEAELVNLIPDGDMESGKSSFQAPYAAQGMSLTYETKAGNTYLCFDATGNTASSWATSLLLYPYAPKANNKYYYSFRAKCSEETAAALNTSGITLWFTSNDTGLGVSKWAARSSFGKYTGTFTAKADGLDLRWFGQNSAKPELANKAKYYIDDVEIYNITNAVEIAYNAVGAAIMPRSTGEYVVDDVNQKIYAKPGAVITFDVKPITEEGKHVKADGFTKVNDTTYTYTVSENAEIAIEYLDNISYVVNGNEIAVTAFSAGPRKLIAASFDGGEMTGAWIGDAATTAPGQTVTFVPEVESLENVKFFCWDDLDSMQPQKNVYKIVPAAQIFLAGDSTCVEYTSMGTSTQGWGYYFKDMVIDKATVVNCSQGGATISSFLDGALYTNMKSAWKAGDYLMIAFGINDCQSVELTEYIEKITGLVAEAKAAGVNALLVKEQDTKGLSGSAAFASFMQALDDIAQQNGVPVLDLNAATKDMPEYCRHTDATHLTPVGANYVAGVIGNILQSADTDLKYYIQ